MDFPEHCVHFHSAKFRQDCAWQYADVSGTGALQHGKHLRDVGTRGEPETMQYGSVSGVHKAPGNAGTVGIGGATGAGNGAVGGGSAMCIFRGRSTTIL